MKASELIVELQKKIAVEGKDFVVMAQSDSGLRRSKRFYKQNSLDDQNPRC